MKYFIALSATIMLLLNAGRAWAQEESDAPKEDLASTVKALSEVLVSPSEAPKLCPETMQLLVKRPDNKTFGYEANLNENFATMATKVMEKFALDLSRGDEVGAGKLFQGWAAENQFYLFLGAKRLPPAMTVAEAIKSMGLVKDLTLTLNRSRKDRPETVEAIYDPEVAEVLRKDLAGIADLLKEDGSKTLMIGMASGNYSQDNNQQFPKELREHVKKTKTGATIMLIDSAFADKDSDRKQIYGNGAFGATHWVQKSSMADGKVKVYENDDDFGGKVTIHVYGTNILKREWDDRSKNLEPTLLGNIGLNGMHEFLLNNGIHFMVGDFHRTSSRPDILGSFP